MAIASDFLEFAVRVATAAGEAILPHFRETIVVEGDGVVGKFPRLETGEHFSYNSYHTIGADSAAEGAYIGVTEDGTPVLARIPRFEMKVPDGS